MDYVIFDSGGVEQIVTSGVSKNLKIVVESPGDNLTTILTLSRTDSDDPPAIY
jgi:hypothetical protein